MVDTFASRFAAIRADLGPLVWGLDPSAELLDHWGLGDTADGAYAQAFLGADAPLGADAVTVHPYRPRPGDAERVPHAAGARPGRRPAAGHGRASGGGVPHRARPLSANPASAL
ncbi:MAG: hypothetical protein JWP48_682 [Actinoallomurus sp.]|nr:hypothetical protein [Actinoallomurus sp.]